MTNTKIVIVTFLLLALVSSAAAQGTAPARIAVEDAKNHVGQTAIVCGKVVDTKVPKYGLAGRGKPVSFYLDQPEPNAAFYFVAFGTQPEGPQEAVSAYEGKRVCVTGEINEVSGKAFILASERSQIKPEAAGK